MTAPTAADTGVLVDIDWAKAHLNAPGVRFVEVNVDTEAYGQGHLPGAVGWNWTSQLTDGIRRDIASRESFGQLLRESGIGPDTTVVLYGDNNNWFAAWAYWQLKLYGHRDVRLLDGGRKKWLALGLETTTETPTHEVREYDLPEPSFELRAFRDDVLSRIGDAGFALVDVRSPAEFSGELFAPANLPQEGAQRAGHIPGAANVPWSTAVNDDGTFRSIEDLRSLYAGKGVTPDRDVVAYCRIGERSSHTWFVLHELLGYDHVRNYDGSWSEWGSLVGVPIAKGADERAA
ncbi:MAG TPA: sulfurtransferase [Candidatus Limnocylindrales bacterium]|nr:sulfurtransferase [Candidatus Limnocylindrales bacterium]